MPPIGSHRRAHMLYRREIDGLRAVAVLPVILFHAGFAVFSGGFVGVDIFFVISGYLITGIILSELAAGHFSIVRFYERRARRILPALFFVIAVSIVMAWLWLLPGDMRSFSRSVLAVALFFSNILFWRSTDYFEAPAELTPLLHTWSLAVEEQFYVFFPIVLLLAWRFARHTLLWLIVLLSLLSLAVAQWGATHEPGAAFYLLPTRGWELAVGCAIAVFCHNAPERRLAHWQAQALSLIGFGLIAFSVFFYDETTPSPGLAMLAPTLGTGLILLFATPATWTARLLSMKPLVAVGLVSYSAYLWHQPLFAFARHRSLHEPDAKMYLALSAVSVGLAWLSWRWVERPFRDKTILGRRQIFAFAATGTLALVLFGVAGHASRGYFWRSEWRGDLARLEDRLRINFGLREECARDSFDPVACRTAAEPELILWGDSYAMHLAQGLLSSNPDIAFVQATRSVCGPLLDVAPVNAQYPESWARDCIAHNARILEFIKSTPSLKYAVLGSPFFRYINPGDRLLLADGRVVESGESGVAALRRTIKTLKDIGVTPVVVAPPPKNGTDVGRCLLKAVRFGAAPETCNFPIGAINTLTTGVYRALAMLQPQVKVIWLHEAICQADDCRATMDGTFVYRDGGHLSHEGSALLGKKLNFYRAVTGTPVDPELASAPLVRHGRTTPGQ